MTARLSRKRRWLAPEVVQTSEMDCGPAVLKCLLEGFGIPVQLGRLREACQTDVDGTSIDVLEEVARQVGLDAEQEMMPVDHLLLPEAEVLPAIVVVRQPAGMTHFVLLWRRHGALVQVLDPAVGRRWMTGRQLLNDIYVHRQCVPAAAWHEWARSEGLLGPLRRRLRDLGLRRASHELIDKAAADPDWRGLAALDAAVRLVQSLELLLASLVLVSGAGGWLQGLLLAACVLAALLAAGRYWRHKRDWTTQRLAMTNEWVEQMIGHRTRLAQQSREHWNEGEDQALERYLGASRELEGSAAAVGVLVPRGWFILGLLGLTPAFVAGSASTVALAVGVGGVVLAYRALHDLVEGLQRLSSAAIAWERVKLFWQAAARREPVGHPNVAAVSAPAEGADSRPETPTGSGADGMRAAAEETALLTARQLCFGYPGRGRPVLQQASLRIAAGDRVLLEGESGGGKSTLAVLLAGSRVPESGLLLFHGFDRETLGAEAWRRKVVIAPQFHHNHVLMGSLAFNVLMGRSWPPQPSDMEEAEQVCRALELGPLLDRMPAGMLQIVGETGWQLSHGEKSRLYIARALLQRADLVILDESFAALDPQTLEHTLACVLRQFPTVLVIAHP